MDVVTTTAAGGTSQLVLEQSPNTAQVHTLRLRARPRVNWEADVVDNEHAGKKKSNREQPYFMNLTFGFAKLNCCAQTLF